jgi:hypothetical protein
LVAAFVLLRWEWRNKGLGKESKNRRANKGCIKIGLGFGIHKNRLYCRKSVYAFRSEGGILHLQNWASRPIYILYFCGKTLDDIE